MSKKVCFTTVSPLPPNVTRAAVIDFFHNHEAMIDLNPLVKERHRIPPPAHAQPDETQCLWYAVTDTVSYLPGVSGAVTYTAAFFNLPNGIQTHSYAPAGVDIRAKWTLNGSLPGEPLEPVELGIGAPTTGLYLREDVELRVSVVMASFVKKTLKKSHHTLLDRVKTHAARSRGSFYHTTATSGLDVLVPLGGRPRSMGDSKYSPAPPPAYPYPAYDQPADMKRSLAVPAAASSPHRRSCPPVMDAVTPPPPPHVADRQARQMELPPYQPANPSAPQGPTRQRSPHDAFAARAANARQHSYSSTAPLVAATAYAVPQLGMPPIQQHNPRDADSRQPNMYPEPLRLRHQSTASTITASSLLYEDVNAAPQPQQQQKQQRPVSYASYGVQHPDYPHLNPYADEDQDEQQHDGGDDDVWQAFFASKARQAEPPVRDGVRRYTLQDPGPGATLAGPFVPELE